MADHRMSKSIPFLFAALSLTTFLRSAPLDLKELPAGTKWFVHVDFDAARSSPVAQALRDVWLAQPDVKQGLSKFKTLTGTDPLEDLHDVTIFNTSFEPNAGAAIIHAKIDKDRLLTIASTLPDHSTTLHARHELESWTDEKSGRRMFGAIRDEQTVIMGFGEPLLGAELDVLDGSADALAGGKSPLAQPPPEGTLFQVAATGLSDAKELPMESPIVKQADDLLIFAGDRDGTAFLRARLVTKSSEVAKQVRSLLEGLRSLVQLQSRQDPEVARFLGPVTTSAQDKAVQVNWKMPSDDVVKGIHDQASKLGHSIDSDTGNKR